MAVLAAAVAGGACWGQAPAEAGAAFDRYVAGVEARMAAQRTEPAGPVVGLNAAATGGSGLKDRLRRGEVVIERLTPGDGAVPGGMLHHWRGTAFAPGARAADFERVMGDFGRYAVVYGPQVVSARWTAGSGDRQKMTMRVRQTHGITVVMDIGYDVTFGRVDGRRGWSESRSTGVREMENAGTARERALGAGEEHGFLWRQDTWWSYEERDGGLYMQVESVTLTRGIPVGVGWMVRPFVESVPRESLEFTLRRTVGAVGRGGRGTE